MDLSQEGGQAVQQDYQQPPLFSVGVLLARQVHHKYLLQVEPAHLNLSCSPVHVYVYTYLRTLVQYMYTSTLATVLPYGDAYGVA
jgi:hypothetical protein